MEKLGGKIRAKQIRENQRCHLAAAFPEGRLAVARGEEIVAKYYGRLVTPELAEEIAAAAIEEVKRASEPAVLEDLFRRRQPDRVVIEVGPAAGWMADLAMRMKIELQVANPSHQGWR